MKVPVDREVYETELSISWIDDDGILNSISKSPTRTVKNTKENFDLVKRLTNNQKICLLIQLSPSGIPDQETRKYVTSELPNVYKAMAMISKPRLSKLIMNFLFRMNAPVIPMKTFSNEGEARVWLKQFQ